MRREPAIIRGIAPHRAVKVSFEFGRTSSPLRIELA